MPIAATIASFGYHEVTDAPWESGFQRPSADPYKLTCWAFRQHLDQLAAVGTEPQLVMDMDLAQPGRHVALTFDDGGKSALHISDELARRGWRGHFFIVTNLLGHRTFLAPAEVRYIRSCGHVIGSHSHTHPCPFGAQSYLRMLAEWRISADRLSQKLGEPCRVGSVPGGHATPMVFAAAAAAGLRYVFTSDPTPYPARVGACWVLGRFIPKVGTSPARVGELAQLRGWGSARLVRRMKSLVHAFRPGWQAPPARLLTAEPEGNR